MSALKRSASSTPFTALFHLPIDTPSASHLLPSLYLKNLLPLRFLQLPCTSIFQSTHLPPIIAWPRWITVPSQPPDFSPPRDGLFLACPLASSAASTTTFLLSKCHRLASPYSRWDQTHSQQLPHTNPHVVFLEDSICLGNENLTSHFSFSPSLLLPTASFSSSSHS